MNQNAALMADSLLPGDLQELDAYMGQLACMVEAGIAAAHEESDLGKTRNEEEDVVEWSEMAVELQRAVESFSKLKFTYVETETKQSFLDCISNNGQLKKQNVSDEELEQLEALAAESKASLVDIAAKIEAAKTAIATASEQVYTAWERFKKRYSKYRAIVDQEREALFCKGDPQLLPDRNRLTSSHVPDEELRILQYAGRNRVDMNSIETCKSILDAQVATIQALHTESHALEQEVARRIASMPALQVQLDEMRREARELEVKLHQQQLQQQPAKQIAWCGALLQLLSQLSGLVIETVKEGEVSLRLLESSKLLQIRCDSGWTRVIEAHVEPSDDGLTTLLNRATGKSLVSLIRTIRGHYARLKRRAQQLQRLHGSYICAEIQPGECFVITLPVGAIATVRLEADYPSTDSVPILEQLDGWKDGRLDLAALNQQLISDSLENPAMDLMGYVANLERVLDASSRSA